MTEFVWICVSGEESDEDEDEDGGDGDGDGVSDMPLDSDGNIDLQEVAMRRVALSNRADLDPFSTADSQRQQLAMQTIKL